MRLENLGSSPGRTCEPRLGRWSRVSNHFSWWGIRLAQRFAIGTPLMPRGLGVRTKRSVAARPRGRCTACSAAIFMNFNFKQEGSVCKNILLMRLRPGVCQKSKPSQGTAVWGESSETSVSAANRPALGNPYGNLFGGRATLVLSCSNLRKDVVDAQGGVLEQAEADTR